CIRTTVVPSGGPPGPSRRHGSRSNVGAVGGLDPCCWSRPPTQWSRTRPVLRARAATWSHRMHRSGLERAIVDPSVYERAIGRFTEAGIVLPTFAQLADPELVEPERIAGLA